MQKTRPAKSFLFSLLGLVLICFPTRINAQQNPNTPSPEEIAFGAVYSATSPAACLAAAEDFVANFPQSAKRPLVAKRVSQQLTILRSPTIAMSLIDRARVIFTSEEELAYLNQVALGIYAKGNRWDAAFNLAAELLKNNPDDLSILLQMIDLGARVAKDKNLTHVDDSMRYGLKAIEMIQADRKPGTVSEAVWLEAKRNLPNLYQQLAIISLAAEKPSEARSYLSKAIDLGTTDPSSYALLGRILSSAYEEQLKASHDGQMSDEKKRLDSMLDEIIDAYAHAVGAATGKREHQTLIQQLVPDLTSYYKSRHNGSTAGLQELLAKYRN